MRGVCAKVALENAAVAALFPKLRDQGVMLRDELRERVDQLEVRFEAESRQLQEAVEKGVAAAPCVVENVVDETRSVLADQLSVSDAAHREALNALSSRLDLEHRAMEQRMLALDQQTLPALQASIATLYSRAESTSEDLRTSWSAEASTIRELVRDIREELREELSAT